MTPSTAAGRALLDEVRRDPMRMRDYLSAILAIEAEARQAAPLDVERLTVVLCRQRQKGRLHSLRDPANCPTHRRQAGLIAAAYAAATTDEKGA